MRIVDLSAFLKHAFSTDAVSVSELCMADSGSRVKYDIKPTRYPTREKRPSKAPVTTVRTGKWIKICPVQHAILFSVNIYERINQHCGASLFDIHQTHLFNNSLCVSVVRFYFDC